MEHSHELKTLEGQKTQCPSVMMAYKHCRYHIIPDYDSIFDFPITSVL